MEHKKRTWTTIVSRRLIAIMIVCILVVPAACSDSNDASDPGVTPSASSDSGVITLLAHDSFAAGVDDATFASFTEKTGVAVEILPAGDAGAMVNQAILTKDDPLADVLFGVDDTFLTRALDEEIFQPTDITVPSLVEGLAIDEEGRVVPIDFGDVCVNYDVSAFVDSERPSTLDDLANPAYADQLVVESPATSSPGLAFLLATIVEYGEDGWQDYWRSLVANGVLAVADWDTAYYTEFTRYGGDRPLVVSYASSPPAEVIFSEEPLDEAPTGVITSGCYRQTEYAGILAGTEQPETARALIEYMTSVKFQERIPLSWFVFPANGDATLPEEFVEHTTIPDAPVSVARQEIDANRERWIDQWAAIVTP